MIFIFVPVGMASTLTAPLLSPPLFVSMTRPHSIAMKVKEQTDTLQFLPKNTSEFSSMPPLRLTLTIPSRILLRVFRPETAIASSTFRNPTSLRITKVVSSAGVPIKPTATANTTHPVKCIAFLQICLKRNFLTFMPFGTLIPTQSLLMPMVVNTLITLLQNPNLVHHLRLAKCHTLSRLAILVQAHPLVPAIVFLVGAPSQMLAPLNTPPLLQNTAI